jgi:hypothetical protein
MRCCATVPLFDRWKGIRTLRLRGEYARSVQHNRCTGLEWQTLPKTSGDNRPSWEEHYLVGSPRVTEIWDGELDQLGEAAGLLYHVHDIAERCQKTADRETISTHDCKVETHLSSDSVVVL